MSAKEPSLNDTEFDLLKKLVFNTANLAGVVSLPLTPGLASAPDGALSIAIVAKYGDLPIDLGDAPVDSVVLVLHSSGIWPVSDHSSGFYIRRGNLGELTDWEEL